MQEQTAQSAGEPREIADDLPTPRFDYLREMGVQQPRRTLTPEESEKQLGSFAKNLERYAGLREYGPRDEMEHERFYDELVDKATSYGHCDELMKMVWSAKAATPNLRHLIDRAPNANIQEVSNGLALRLFPKSLFVVSVESEVLALDRHYASVVEAQYETMRLCRVYRRLCKRHNRAPCATNDRLLEVIRTALPEEIDLLMRRHHADVTNMDEFWAFALEREAESRRRPMIGALEEGQIRPDPCVACGTRNPTHVPETCWAKGETCHACKQKGHVRRVCPYVLEKNALGDGRVTVTHSKGRTTLTARHDYRDADRVKTAGGAIEALRESAADRAQQAKAKRRIYKRKPTAQAAATPSKVARPPPPPPSRRQHASKTGVGIVDALVVSDQEGLEEEIAAVIPVDTEASYVGDARSSDADSCQD